MNATMQLLLRFWHAPLKSLTIALQMLLQSIVMELFPLRSSS